MRYGSPGRQAWVAEATTCREAHRAALGRGAPFQGLAMVDRSRPRAALRYAPGYRRAALTGLGERRRRVQGNRMEAAGRCDFEFRQLLCDRPDVI